MALVFKTPTTVLNTTTRDIQNIKDGECPPCPECPECPEVELTTAEVEYTENGSFTVTPESGFDGLSQVDITVNIDTQAIEDAAYAEGEAAGIVTGKAQGVAEQKAKLTSTTLTTNGTVTREDGWNEVTVNVDTTTPYNEGVAAGIAEQKAKLTSTTITENGTTTREDGFNSVTVNVQPDLETKTASYTSNGEYTITPTTGKDGISEATITVDVPSDVNNQDKTVSPTTSSQSVTADSGYSGLGTVTVEAVTSSIDANIAAGNIKKNVSILGVTGSYDPQPTLQAKTATPTTSQQVITADSGNDGLSQVTVEGVTSAIDANITASNIKKDVTILGVTGTYEDTPDLETKSVTYTANDTYTITPTAGKDGMSSVEVTVNVAGGGGTQCLDWSSMGWSCEDVTASGIDADIAVTAALLENYDPNTSGTGYWKNKQIVYAPNIVIRQSSTIIESGIFAANAKLEHLPQLTFKSGTFGMNNYPDCNCNGLFSGCTSLKKAHLDLTDYGNGTASNGYVVGGRNLFNGCTSLTDVEMLNTNGLTSMKSMFYNCTSLSAAPTFNTSNIESMEDAFYNCSSLSSVPLYDTSNVTTMYRMFCGCLKLTTIPSFNTSKVTDMRTIFGANAFQYSQLESIGQLDCTLLQSCGFFTNATYYNKLKTLGGFVNLGKSFTINGSLDLSKAPSLTKESIMNVINNLAAPDDTTVTNATLKLSATSYALLTAEDIAIATAKNWSVVSA